MRPLTDLAVIAGLVTLYWVARHIFYSQNLRNGTKNSRGKL
jgi:hypothetical protein